MISNSCFSPVAEEVDSDNDESDVDDDAEEGNNHDDNESSTDDSTRLSALPKASL